MMQLIADSGATKTLWCLTGSGKTLRIETEGISPYYFTREQIAALVASEVWPKLKRGLPEAIHFYGTGCGTPENQKHVAAGIKQAVGKGLQVNVKSDLLAAARSLCGRQKGIACILGTGSNSAVYNGKNIVRNHPAAGYILGDEGSGAYLGKKVVQYYINKTFDADLESCFRSMYEHEYRNILDRVYKQPWPNRYLSSHTTLLSQNRGHYMVENILEDGLSDFFTQHLFKYPETWKYPIHFTGSIAWHFKDVLRQLADAYQVRLGTIVASPMEGLLKFHQSA